MDPITSALATAFGASIIWYLLYRKSSSSIQENLKLSELQVRELEKSLHVKERDFLEEKNRIELGHSEKMKQEKDRMFKDGREIGLREAEKDHLIALTTQKSELSAVIQSERDSAAQEAREKQRREYELQTKMFSVSIRPYVKITKCTGMFTDEVETESGYQYQLLVNGIPAFKPHVIIEANEKQAKFKEENLKFLVEQATKAAEVAVQIYMGGNGQYIKYSPELVERAVKK